MRPRLIRTPMPQRIDPVAAFRALAGPGDLFFLDGGIEGWSYLGTGTPVLPGRGRVLDALRAELANPAPEADDDAAPFRLGLVGWFGYGLGAETAGAPEEGPGRYPDCALLRVTRALAIDGRTGAAELLSTEDDPAWRRDIVSRLSESPRPVGPLRRVGSDAVLWADDEDAYIAKVHACLDAIAAGEAYQLCLTTHAEVDGDLDPVAVALALRASSPSHHGGVIRIGGTTLVSASPERFLEVGRDGTVATRPIKGTRPRSAFPDEDRALAAELRASEKEQAENLMIVDLMRNDLARVCEIGSVAVTRLFDVESYPAVHQLVSEVQGRLLPGRSAIDALGACFPAGSMTGAPKLRAMQLLAGLETGSRGVYAGAFGWLGFDGAADLAMVIRSIVIDDRGASVGTGGGITALSDPAAEFAEMRLKAAAPLAALGVEG